MKWKSSSHKKKLEVQFSKKEHPTCESLLENICFTYKPKVRKKGQMLVFICGKIFDGVLQHALAHKTHEVGGVLLGTYSSHRKNPFLLIDWSIKALHSKERCTSITFTHKTWDYISQEMRAKCPDKMIIGWYHTHPGFGVFLSPNDTFIQNNFFNAKHQVALVVDPISKKLTLFSWIKESLHETPFHILEKSNIGPRFFPLDQPYTIRKITYAIEKDDSLKGFQRAFFLEQLNYSLRKRANSIPIEIEFVDANKP